MQESGHQAIPQALDRVNHGVLPLDDWLFSPKQCAVPIVSSVATATSLIGTGAPEGTAPAALHLAAQASQKFCVKSCKKDKN